MALRVSDWDVMVCDSGLAGSQALDAVPLARPRIMEALLGACGRGWEGKGCAGVGAPEAAWCARAGSASAVVKREQCFSARAAGLPDHVLACCHLGTLYGRRRADAACAAPCAQGSPLEWCPMQQLLLQRQPRAQARTTGWPATAARTARRPARRVGRRSAPRWRLARARASYKGLRQLRLMIVPARPRKE